MLRQIATALVILGLLIQPPSAAVPDFTPFDQSSSPISGESPDKSTGGSHHGTIDYEKASDTPCHESPQEQVNSIVCAECEDSCTAGTCASVCSMGTAAVFDQSYLKSVRLLAIHVRFYHGSVPQGLPASIFHPPKHE